MSSRILGVVLKIMEFAGKESHCIIALEIEKGACFSNLSEISSRIL